MTAITISVPQSSVQSKYTFTEIERIEKQVAFLESGSNALAGKSLRSLRHSLLKKLSSRKKVNILSFEPAAAWAKDASLLKRLGAGIIFTEDLGERDLTDVLLLNDINVVYLATVHSSNLSVEDFSFIITQAHSLYIPVIFDNTSGGLGSMYAPLANGADYVLTDVSRIEQFADTSIGAFLIEGISSVYETKSALLSGETIVKRLKDIRQTLSIRNHSPQLPLTPLEKTVTSEYFHFVEYSVTTNNLSKWLNSQPLVMEVWYPGLKYTAGYLNADYHFRHSYGNALKFSLWDNVFGYTLLKGYFTFASPKGVTIRANKETREFYVEVRTDNFIEVITWFQHVFSNLNKNIEYKRSLEQKKKVEEVLRYASRISAIQVPYKRI